MTSQDSTQAGGWVERAFNLAYCMADALREKTFRQMRRVPQGDPRDAQDIYDMRAAQLRAHLTTHASQQAAVVAGLVGALEEALTDAEEAIDRHVMAYGENYRAARLKGMRDQLAKGRAAIAAASDHAMKEQP